MSRFVKSKYGQLYNLDYVRCISVRELHPDSFCIVLERDKDEIIYASGFPSEEEAIEAINTFWVNGHFRG
jgi:hypothetical protein